MTPRVLFLDSNHSIMISTLRATGVQCDEDYSSTYEQVLEKIAMYEGVIIRSRFKLDARFLDAATHLKVIGRAGAGMENIDVSYATSKGIACVHAPEGNRDAVAEQAIGMLLALMNNLLRADREVRRGIWKREENRGYELCGKTVGIIGYGNMGSAFAQRLKGFGVEVLAHDKYTSGFGDALVKEVSLEEIQQRADVISLHLPLTTETIHYINDDFISKLQKPVYLINTARGKNLDTAAVVAAMKSGKVIGVCLDVLEYESVSFEKLDSKTLPEPFQYLINSDRAILSPHIAGWTFESHEKIGRVIAEKVLRVLLP